MILSRRKFLNTVVLSASAVAVTSLVGCGSEADADTSSVTSCNTFTGDGAFKHSIMSGDPRQTSVILWTRINDECELAAGSNVNLIAEVATDKAFTNVLISEVVSALAEYDHNIKLRITGLSEDTRYYYRFSYIKDGTTYISNTGRTRTAQDPDAATQRPVRFAYVSCQDYIGRYFNNYLSLLTDLMLDGASDDNDDEGLDFIVHLGDYIYETTGDPSFQAEAGERVVSFTDLEGAIKLGSTDTPYYAAQSLSNYRELYQTYRTDELLQKIQENFPMIVTWDDHEFSDDSWQNTATYFDGAVDETGQTTRKHNSERAYFECMPIDHEWAQDADSSIFDASSDDSEQQTALGITDQQLFPNTKIYRDFKFGNKIHLLMTDYRTHRPDHLIPEEAFPGVVALTEEQLIPTLIASGALASSGIPATTSVTDAVAVATAQGAARSLFDKYIDIDDAQYIDQKNMAIMAAAASYEAAAGGRMTTAQANTLAVEQVTGMQSVSFINLLLDGALDTFKGLGLLASTTTIADIAIVAPADAKAGISYFILGKTSFISEIGSRYNVVKDTFDLLAFYKTAIAGSTANPYGIVDGNDQMTWISNQLQSSVATQSWRILGSSVSFSPLIQDLRPSSSGRPAITGADITAATGVTGAVADGTAAAYEGVINQIVDGLLEDPFTALLANRFYLNVDHWDGFPIYKAGLMSNPAGTDVFGQTGVITIAGDIHSSYVGKQPLSSNGTTRSFDMTTSSISSGTFSQFMTGALNSILTSLDADTVASLTATGAVGFLKDNWSVIVQTASGSANAGSSNTELKRARLNEHGVVTVVANTNNTIDFTYHAVPDGDSIADGADDLVKTSFYDNVDTFLGNVTKTTYRIENNDISEV